MYMYISALVEKSTATPDTFILFMKQNNQTISGITSQNVTIDLSLICQGQGKGLESGPYN